MRLKLLPATTARKIREKTFCRGVRGPQPQVEVEAEHWVKTGSLLSEKQKTKLFKLLCVQHLPHSVLGLPRFAGPFQALPSHNRASYNERVGRGASGRTKWSPEQE